MATVLTEPTGVAAEEMVHVSIPILKWEEDPDGDLIVKGIATDGTVDSDSQIVDPDWSAKALQTWIATGGNLRQSHDPHRPVGKGLRVDVNKDNGGKHWVTSLVVDPLAQKLVKKGVLTAYSVGISRPVIKHDPSGRARGGIIVDGELAELSLVDRPSNKSSYLELAKSAADGTCEFTGKVVGRDVLQEMLGEPAPAQKSADISSFDASELADLNITFTPNDMASLVMKKVKEKVISEHYSELARDAKGGYDPFRYSTAEKRNFDPGVGGGVDRDKLSESDFAGPHRSFPIVNQSDVSDALHLTGHADDPAAVRARIKAIARRKGLSVPDDDDKGTVPDVADIAVPDEVKDQNGESGPAVSPVSKIPGAKKVTEEPLEYPCPPSVSKKKKPGKDMGNVQNLDADGDTDGDGIGALENFTGNAGPGVPSSATAKAAKPKMPKPKKGGKGDKKMPPWVNKPASSDDDDCKVDHVHTEKCHTPPDRAAGVSGHDMQAAPVGELQEYPGYPHTRSQVKAESVALRYKTVGIDFDLGALHDFTCPAYNPAEVDAVHPLADLSTLINENVWQRKALTAATGSDMAAAKQAQAAWQAASVLKSADLADLNAYRMEMHKAFRDANPGVASYPSPGSISPQRFHRPCITDGHATLSPGYGPPNTSAMIPDSAPNAHSFGRPPLSAGQESPSPSFMKATQPYPDQHGVITHLDYPQIERDKARRSLAMLHDHLQHQFPLGCPMIEQDAYRIDTPTPSVGPIAGMGKTIEPDQQAELLSDVYKYIKKLEKQIKAGLITEEQAREKLSKRTAENYARKLSRDVKKGMTSIDEVAKALGIERPEPVQKGATLDRAEVNKDGLLDVAQRDTTTKSITPDVMKTMMSEILQPLQQQIAAQDERIAQYQQLLTEQQEAMKAQKETYDKRWEALANTADPSTNPLIPALRKAAGPAAIAKQAEVSEHVHGMMLRQLERTWRTSENPAEREAAYAALNRMKNEF